MKIVVVGYGMAGARVASELHARSPEASVTVVGEEPHRAYNRILLSGLVAGKSREADIHLIEPTGRGVDVRLGVGAVRIDRAQRSVTTSTGSVLPYDRLVLAT